MTSVEKRMQDLTESSLLNFPDNKSVLSIVIDASNVAMGGVLQQQSNDAWRPIVFFSKKLIIDKSDIVHMTPD